MNQIELGLRIKQRRKMKKLTQENLAELINVSPHYIYELEKGLKTMSLSTLVDISTALNISTDYLLFGTQPVSTSSTAEIIPSDKLNSILQNLSPQKRDDIANILSVLLQYLK